AHRVQVQFGAVISTKSYLPAGSLVAQLRPLPGAAPAITEVHERPAPVVQVKRVTSALQTVTVGAPRIDLPAMKEIVVVPAGAGDNPMASLDFAALGSARRYDEAIRIPPEAAADAFDVYWLPAQGKRLALARHITFDQQHPAFVFRPEESIGMVRL